MVWKILYMHGWLREVRTILFDPAATGYFSTLLCAAPLPTRRRRLVLGTQWLGMPVESAEITACHRQNRPGDVASLVGSKEQYRRDLLVKRRIAFQEA